MTAVRRAPPVPMHHHGGARDIRALSSGSGISSTASTATILRLTAYYCIWKVVLLAVAVASPGPGYDTSTDLLFDLFPSSLSHSASWLSHVADTLAAKLVRWDALYFTTSSVRGLLYEQEWAFSPTLAKFTSHVARGLCSSPFTCHALAGILVSHFAHLLSVILLFQLTYSIIPASREKRSKVAFATACLHILSPAGLFLSAPYGEAIFALANFLGMYCYVAARKTNAAGIASAFTFALWIVSCGIAFGIATAARSNGLLSGLILAWDAVAYVPELGVLLSRRDWSQLLRLGAVLVAGFTVAVGYAFPQAVAYMEYCMQGNTRPWCGRLLPSIYGWVQGHYWGVGFLRYWTLSNLPLFLLATPMILLLIGTAQVALSSTELRTVIAMLNAHEKANQGPTDERRSLFLHTMTRFALPQLILAILATTSFHVQIINRISSGYPVWYILLGIVAQSDFDPGRRKTSVLNAIARNVGWITRAATMYAIIQGGLFASFMPPA